MNRNPLFLSLVALSCGACGAGAITHRNVDTVVGHTDAYGAPGRPSYSARAETDREVIRLTVMERAECQKLKMKVIQRVTETVKGDTVISREPAKQLQVPDGSYGVVPCNERYARNVWVALRVGAQTYRLGMPTPKGEVIANLAGELKQGLYAEGAPNEATVVVDGKDSGQVSLAAYTSHEARVGALLDEMRVVLAKDPATLTKDDITRSYELYSQLGQLNTGGDARIAGVRARFLELLYERKLDESTERFRRNLKALAEAKGLVAGLAAGAVPPYVMSSITGGVPAMDAVMWARGEVAVALRQSPALCGPGPFTWNRITPSLDPTSRLAFSYLRFAYDDPFQTEVRGLCGRLAGW